MLAIEITILAVAYVGFSVTTQRKLTNPKRTFEIQQEIKKKTTELNEMVKAKASQEQLVVRGVRSGGAQFLSGSRIHYILVPHSAGCWLPPVFRVVLRRFRD